MSHLETHQGISTGAIIAIIFSVLLLGVCGFLIYLICIVFYKDSKLRLNRHINQQRARGHPYSISTDSHDQSTDISDMPRPGLYETDHHQQRLDDTEYHEPTISEHNSSTSVDSRPHLAIYCTTVTM